MTNLLKRGFGSFTAIVGVLLILAALWLTLSNIHTDNAAGAQNTILLTRIADSVPEREEVPEGNGWSVLPRLKLVNDPAMPTVEIEGNPYIGVLAIPSLGLELSVMDTCDDETVDTAPGRFAGTAYENGFVIGGHNYVSHLGKIDRLREGDTVIFTDLEGNAFTYKVVGTEILEGWEADELRSDEQGRRHGDPRGMGSRRAAQRRMGTLPVHVHAPGKPEDHGALLKGRIAPDTVSQVEEGTCGNTVE